MPRPVNTKTRGTCPVCGYRCGLRPSRGMGPRVRRCKSHRVPLAFEPGNIACPGVGRVCKEDEREA